MLLRYLNKDILPNPSLQIRSNKPRLVFLKTTMGLIVFSLPVQEGESVELDRLIEWVDFV